jgi:serine/threonine protein kinase
MGKKI